ncbi:MAG: type II toxin-antitoxin system RelE/ParE family toxin [Candidatus Omnitrophica bacterium]|nr:type II toxin-antitoxin system RelE/ParE family toxin [Candidatus Omnitrophota bacterium]
MKKYAVQFPTSGIRKKFQKALQSISSVSTREEIMTAVEALADHPRPFGEPKIKPPLIVYSFTAQYRIRIGNYRVLYDVDDSCNTVWILDVRKRNERTYR